MWAERNETTGLNGLFAWTKRSEGPANGPFITYYWRGTITFIQEQLGVSVILNVVVPDKYPYHIGDLDEGIRTIKPPITLLSPDMIDSLTEGYYEIGATWGIALVLNRDTTEGLVL